MEYLQLVLAIFVVIVVHEFGHFLVARMYGLSVPVFSVGFGKKLYSFNHKNTEYRFSLIPLGGYIEVDTTNESWFRNAMVCIAGPISNLLLAIFVIVSAAIYTKGGDADYIGIVLLIIKEFFMLVPNFIIMLYELFGSSGAESGSNFSSVVNEQNVGMAIEKTVEGGFLKNLFIISLIVGAFNLLPIPSLDGGRIVFHSLPEKVAYYVQIIGLVIILGLMIVEAIMYFYAAKYFIFS